MTRYKIILHEGYYIISDDGIKTYSCSTQQYVIGELFNSQGHVITKGAIDIQSYIACFKYNY